MNSSYEQSLKVEGGGGFLQRLRSLCAYEIGVIPLPIFLGIALIVFLSAHLGFLPKNMIGGLVVIMTMGVFLVSWVRAFRCSRRLVAVPSCA
jgi:malate:Na+ symporter